MLAYETLLLLSPELGEDERNSLLEGLTQVVESEGGKIVEMDHWGSKTLAYPVRKQTRGYYVRMDYDAPAQLIAELERKIRLNDEIFKFVTVKLDRAADAQAEAAAEA